MKSTRAVLPSSNEKESLGRWDAMTAKCSSLLLVLATCIVAGRGSPNTTDFLAREVANHSNATGPAVSQKANDVKTMLMDLAKENIFSPEIQNVLAKIGPGDAKTTQNSGSCESKCNVSYYACLVKMSRNTCLALYKVCSSACVVNDAISR